MMRPNDPLDLIAGMLANLYVRFVLLAATIFLGLTVAQLALGLVGFLAGAGIGSLAVVALLTLIVVITLVTAESSAVVGLALATNFLAWVYAGLAIGAILSRA